MERIASSSRGYLLEATLLKSYFRVPQREDSIVAEAMLPELIFKFLEKRTTSSSRGYLLEATLLKNYFRVPVKRVTRSQRVYLRKGIVRKTIPRRLRRQKDYQP